MQIRKAVIDDLRDIMEIYHIAQEFMIESGNPNQWGHRYLGEDLIRDYIANGVCRLICDDDGGIHGVLLFSVGMNQHINISKMANGLMMRVCDNT